MAVNRLVATAVASSVLTVAAIAIADAITHHLEQTAHVTASGGAARAAERGYVTDVPCYRSVELADSRGVTTTIDVAIAGPQNHTTCAAGNPLDGRSVAAMTITEQTIDRLPDHVRYACEAGTEDLTWLVYDDGTPNSGVAALGFCRGIGRLQP